MNSRSSVIRGISWLIKQYTIYMQTDFLRLDGILLIISKICVLTFYQLNNPISLFLPNHNLMHYLLFHCLNDFSKLTVNLKFPVNIFRSCQELKDCILCSSPFYYARICLQELSWVTVRGFDCELVDLMHVRFWSILAIYIIHESGIDFVKLFLLLLHLTYKTFNPSNMCLCLGNKALFAVRFFASGSNTSFLAPCTEPGYLNKN